MLLIHFVLNSQLVFILVRALALPMCHNQGKFVAWGPFLESPEKPFVKLRPAYFAKLVLSYVVKGIKIKKLQSFVPRDALVLKTQSEMCHPKWARKVSRSRALVN